MLSQLKRFQERVGRHGEDQRGQGLVEYALILLLIAIVVLAMVKGIGITTNDSFGNVNSALNAQ